MTKSIDELQKDVRSRAESIRAEGSAKATAGDENLHARPNRADGGNGLPSRSGEAPDINAAERERLNQVANRGSQGVRRTTQ